MTSIAQLSSHLDQRVGFKTTSWVDQLEPRKREEIDFHNFDRETTDQTIVEAQKYKGVHANKKYYAVTDTSVAWLDQWIKRHVKDKVFLDYACGNGLRTIQAARDGARISIGIDISDVSIRNARDMAMVAGTTANSHFIQGDCEMTELPPDSIDTILCCGMLHHLDLDRAYPELHRILRPGGRVLGVEALGHNPVIQAYRNLTPHLRTEWEAKHILKLRDIRRAESYFQRGETRFWHLASLAAVPLRRTPLFGPALKLGNAVDSALLSLPGLRLMAWQVTFELIKSAD